MTSSNQKKPKISRRKFLGGTAAVLTVAASDPHISGRSLSSSQTGKTGFNLKYAPSLGMFREHAGKDPLDHLRFMAAEGFRAYFDNGMMNRSPEQQQAIAREAERLKLSAGPFVAYADFAVKSFVTRDPEIRRMLKARMEEAVETAKRTGSRWALVVPGRFDEGLEWDYQTANVVDNLKFCAEIFEPSGLIMVIEPLNPWKDHPGLFLTKIPQAYAICRAVNSPFCKIVNDLYHQQITEGNLIPNIDFAWSEIAAFHIGDNPGRKEPTTGEINYQNIFAHVYKKGYQGILCMEHGKSLSGKQGERAVIDAYRVCDDFPV